jgi:outer membrane protein assembly factor BamB
LRRHFVGTRAAFAELPGATSTPLPAAPLGHGAWRFKVESNWAKLPEGQTIGATHGGIVVDQSGKIYVSSDGPQSVMVFAPDGKLLRNFPAELSGMHGLMIREENGTEYIYGAHVTKNEVVKMNLDGSVVWKIGVPHESGLYKKDTDYRPTAVAVVPDGRILVADGYGASIIHEYSPERKWLRVIGSRGTGDGQFRTCHGITYDPNHGQPRLLVCDRENKRIVQLDLQGNFVRTLATDLRRPCAISLRNGVMAVAELEGRVALLDGDGKLLGTLGDNPDQKQWAQFKLAPEFWQDGIFIAPHGVAWDAAGNLFVQDWNFAGRLTKLRHVAATE